MSRLRDVPVVNLLVGPDKTACIVHLNLLSNCSSYFRAAFAEGRFQEGKTRSIELVDDDVEAVGRLVQWLYRSSYDLSSFETEENANQRFFQLAKLNTLADKYDIPHLTNDIIDRIWDANPEIRSRRSHTFAPRVSLVAYVYDNTNQTSSFRKLMVAWYAWEVPLRWYEADETKEELADISHDFALDLVVAFAQQKRSPDQTSPFTWDRFIYYKEALERPERIGDGNKK